MQQQNYIEPLSTPLFAPVLFDLIRSRLVAEAALRKEFLDLASWMRSRLLRGGDLRRRRLGWWRAFRDGRRHCDPDVICCPAASVLHFLSRARASRNDSNSLSLSFLFFAVAFAAHEPVYRIREVLYFDRVPSVASLRRKKTHRMMMFLGICRKRALNFLAARLRQSNRSIELFPSRAGDHISEEFQTRKSLASSWILTSVAQSRLSRGGKTSKRKRRLSHTQLLLTW